MKKNIVILITFLFAFSALSQQVDSSNHKEKIESYLEEMSEMVDSLGFNKLNRLLAIELKENDAEITEEQYYKRLALLKIMLDRERNNFIISEHILYTDYSEYIRSEKEQEEKRKKIGQVSIDSKHVLFSKIEKSPTAKRCNKVVDNLKRKACLNEDFRQYIVENFDTNKATKMLEENNRFEKGEGSGFIARVYISFIINEIGRIEDVEGFSEYEELIEMCEKLIEKHPKLVPGVEENSIKVRTSFNLPIVFQIE